MTFHYVLGLDCLDILGLLDIIIKMFKDESAVAIKQNCHAAKYCILGLTASDYNIYAYELVRQLLSLQNCSYWLIKVS